MEEKVVKAGTRGNRREKKWKKYRDRQQVYENNADRMEFNREEAEEDLALMVSDDNASLGDIDIEDNLPEQEKGEFASLSSKWVDSDFNEEQETMLLTDITKYVALREEDMKNEINSEDTILIKRTMRCGQSIFYPGNVVILGDINPGAEILAGGNIIVMGAVRGIAHAGAMGDENAMIMAFRLDPTQLRIANYITRAPEGEDWRIDQPEIAQVQDGMVIIEKYQPNMGGNSKDIK